MNKFDNLGDRMAEVFDTYFPLFMRAFAIISLPVLLFVVICSCVVMAKLVLSLL